MEIVEFGSNDQEMFRTYSPPPYKKTMNPSPAAVTWIQSYVTGLTGSWSGNTDRAVVAAANTPSVTNPQSAPTVQTPYTAVSLLSLLSSGSAANLVTFPAIHDLFADIASTNSAAVLDAVALLVTASRITSSEATAITAAVTATEPQPGWPAQIGVAQANLGRVLDTSDVAAARAAAGQQPNP